jgi:hypothetical protein
VGVTSESKQGVTAAISISRMHTICIVDLKSKCVNRTYGEHVVSGEMSRFRMYFGNAGSVQL